ncbi:MAG: hypothetical protein AB8G15_10215 [Saprospiraceae bacterium]
MIQTQVISVSFFSYQGNWDKWWAFQQMGLPQMAINRAKGLQFWKMLGSGAESGFGLKPNFGAYGMLCVWDNENAARQFFQENSGFLKFKTRCEEYWTVFLQTSKVHGLWSGRCPFEPTISSDDHTLTAVLTRATIKYRHLLNFWQHVPKVSQSIENRKGLIFSIGVGELPLVQQATFSLWESARDMMDYAYRSHYHKEVVQKTRKLGWYREEMFARFSPFATEGSWQGENPLKKYLQQN